MIYHMEVSDLSRGKGRSLGASLSYISGEKIHDSYSGKTTIIAEPIGNAGVLSSEPPGAWDIQYLCDELNKAEKRKELDRTAVHWFTP